ncbi:MAG: hypothetical protein FWD05_12575, partial [Oscillospiraceae bacterium]|nr:hypothetical protein [Oscillospiraceae bacterium]
MSNSNVRLGSNMKNRIIAFSTAIMLFVSMLSLTTLVAAEEADYAPEEAVVEEYVPAPEPEPEPEQPTPEVEDGDDAVAETPDYDVLYEDDDDEGYDDNEEYEQAVLSIVNFPGNLTHRNQSAIVLRDNVVQDDFTSPFWVTVDALVSLEAGEVDEAYEFIGWFRGSEAPARGTHIDELIYNVERVDNQYVVTDEDYNFAMPEDAIQYFALWGYNNYIGRSSGYREDEYEDDFEDEYKDYEVVDLSLYNVPSELTHIGQTAEVYTSVADDASIINVYGIIDVEVVEDTTVTLTSGDVEEAFDFLGWY